jgi:hypothetical protein
MANPLKRRFDPVRELEDESWSVTPSSSSFSVENEQVYDPGLMQDYEGMYGPRQSQYLGPNHINPLRYEDSA